MPPIRHAIRKAANVTSSEVADGKLFKGAIINVLDKNYDISVSGRITLILANPEFGVYEIVVDGEEVVFECEHGHQEKSYQLLCPCCGEPAEVQR